MRVSHVTKFKGAQSKLGSYAKRLSEMGAYGGAV